jgi:hypothetical protein
MALACVVNLALCLFNIVWVYARRQSDTLVSGGHHMLRTLFAVVTIAVGMSAAVTQQDVI